MSEFGSEEETQTSHKLVPWFSWDEWNFVRRSIFSSSEYSVSEALARIATWRSRGCLPNAVEVTAALVEVWQKDPLFRKCLPCDASNSDEILAMGYCMAIMRLVNSFAERSRKKTGLSISESADAIGIPRMLIDIRHECSHRQLPSLPLVQLASKKALDWLKSYYWEPQRKLIPNVKKEVKARLREMTVYLNAKHESNACSSEVKQRSVKHCELVFGRKRSFSHMSGQYFSSKVGGSQKSIGKISRSLIRLYSGFPSEVLSALLEEFLKKPLCFSEDDNSQVDAILDKLKSFYGKNDAWKTAVTRVARQMPAFLLAMVDSVLQMLESRQLSMPQVEELRQIDHLSRLVLWLLHNLRKQNFQEPLTSGNIADWNSNPKEKLVQLLRKCLLLSPGNNLLLTAAVVLAKMIGKDSLAEKIKNLPFLNPSEPDTLENSCDDHESTLQQHEDSLKHAESISMGLELRGRKNEKVCAGDSVEDRIWILAKSWSPSPIGMLPYSLSSSTIPPVHWKTDAPSSNIHEITESAGQPNVSELSAGRVAHRDDVEFVGSMSPKKKFKEAVGNDELITGNDCVPSSPRKGKLLIGGVWKEVGKEELLAIESGVRILV